MMTHQPKLPTAQESLFTIDLAERLLPFIKAEAARPTVAYMINLTKPGGYYPFFCFNAERPSWKSWRAWRKPHAEGKELDMDAFRRVLARGGLKGYKLSADYARGGKITGYWVTYAPPKPQDGSSPLPPTDLEAIGATPPKDNPPLAGAAALTHDAVSPAG